MEQQLCDGTYRHDADLALAGLDDAGAVGADQPSSRLALDHLLHLHLNPRQSTPLSLHASSETHIQSNLCSSMAS